jgi:hypothetical protein
MNAHTLTELRLFETFSTSPLSSCKVMCFCKISVTITPFIKCCCVETDVDPYNSLRNVSEK